MSQPLLPKWITDLLQEVMDNPNAPQEQKDEAKLRYERFKRTMEQCGEIPPYIQETMAALENTVLVTKKDPKFFDIMSFSINFISILGNTELPVELKGNMFMHFQSALHSAIDIGDHARVKEAVTHGVGIASIARKHGEE